MLLGNRHDVVVFPDGVSYGTEYIWKLSFLTSILSESAIEKVLELSVQLDADDRLACFALADASTIIVIYPVVSLVPL